jgi:hypothetical protein
MGVCYGKKNEKLSIHSIYLTGKTRDKVNNGPTTTAGLGRVFSRRIVSRKKKRRSSLAFWFIITHHRLIISHFSHRLCIICCPIGRLVASNQKDQSYCVLLPAPFTS